jgi:hypothetical protein
MRSQLSGDAVGAEKRPIYSVALCALQGAILLAFAGAPAITSAGAQSLTVITAAPLSLRIGMHVDEVEQVLGVPLQYIRGSVGNELFLAIPNVKGSALSWRSDGLYLQFRKRRLTGWKGDWGTIRP